MRIYRRLLPALFLCLLAPAAAGAEENPISGHTKFTYSALKKILLQTAESAPEEVYRFKPTEAVRSLGQIVGHVADAQYNFCSMASGEKSPAPHIEKTKSTKAELVAALKDAFAYCDRVYDGMTDAAGVQTVKAFGRDTPKLGVLMINNVHASEHYGNLVTYLRLKGMVPPTSDPAFMQQMRQ